MLVNKNINVYKQNDIKDWREAQALEKLGQQLIVSFQKNNHVDPSTALKFVSRVEKWKAMRIKSRIFGVGVTTADEAQIALTLVFQGATDKKKFEALHSLKGFGVSTHNVYKTRPAKVASAAMRFLYPNEWGVIDWRSGAIADSILTTPSLSKAIEKAKNEGKTKWRNHFGHVDFEWAGKINNWYSNIGKLNSISRNADVDQFLFGISLEIWPLKKKC